MRHVRASHLAAVAFGLSALAGAPGGARAQGWIEPLEPVPWPALERIRQDVTITVDPPRRVAHVEVEEEFRNRGHGLLEGDYLYPVPPDAVFTDLSLYAGAQELKGEVLPAERARAIYEAIVRRRKDPALVELVGHGVLRARVFPIEPGGTRRIVLRYTQVLGREGDALRLRYLRTVAFAPADAGRHLERDPQPPRRPPATAFRLRVRVRDADALGAPYSPTHTLEVERRGAVMEIALPNPDPGRDVEIFLPLRTAFVGAAVVAHARDGEPGFFLLLLSPRAAPEADPIPRDVTLVLDVSGSMSGTKIEQARAALEQILGGLWPADRFRLVAFQSVVTAFRPDFVAATPANLRAAREFLAGLRAEGGTNLEAALREALEPASAAGRLPIVVVLTDGKPTVGETEPERIAEMAERWRDGERIFAFGVGHDVNTYLLDRLVERGRGTVAYVRPDEDVEQAVASLASRIRHPALSDLRVARAPVEWEDVYPARLPDLFYGQELVVLGRYRGPGRGPLVLEGTRNGRTERFEFRVEFPEREPGNAWVPRLWAARKVGALTAQIRLHGADPELVEEVRRLGLRYGILTEYTSYLVEEPQLALEEDAAGLARRVGSMRAAPAQQSGASEFRRAREAAELGMAYTLGAVPTARIRGGEALARFAGDRWFALRDSVWTDLRCDDRLKMAVLEVAPFSDAYFEIARRRPDLRVYLALGARVCVAGDGLALRIAPGGREALRPDDWRRLAAAFPERAGT
jgi:Ca-activated chloride channel family protein